MTRCIRAGAFTKPRIRLQKVRPPMISPMPLIAGLTAM